MRFWTNSSGTGIPGKNSDILRSLHSGKIFIDEITLKTIAAVLNIQNL